MPDLTLAAFPEFETRWMPQIASRYGVRNVEFMPLAGISSYTLLSQGKVQAAGIFTTDPQLISTKYVVLAGAAQHVRLPARRARALEEARRRERDELHLDDQQGQRAADPAGYIAMNKAVGVDKKPAATVAKAFLKANKLT